MDSYTYINNNDNDNVNIYREEINYPSNITSIQYNNPHKLLCAGDQKGKMAFFDMRINKAIKLIKTDNYILGGNKDMEIKYIYFTYFYSH